MPLAEMELEQAPVSNGRSVGLISLGCSKNLVDSEVMLGLLQGAGYSITGDVEEADAIIVNTCGFLGAAVEESLQTLSEVAARKKTGRVKAVVATGCLPQGRGRRHHGGLIHAHSLQSRTIFKQAASPNAVG